MSRESARTKGLRYLLEGRLLVQEVDGDHVAATCRGNGEVYELGHELARGWACSCPAAGVCAHLVALMAVTVRRGRATA